MECIAERIPLETLNEMLKDAEERFEDHLKNAVEFAKTAFGIGPETISLVTGLISCYNVVMFSRPGGNLYRYNDELLCAGRDRKLQSILEGL
jgi:hypothetical protein